MFCVLRRSRSYYTSVVTAELSIARIVAHVDGSTSRGPTSRTILYCLVDAGTLVDAVSAYLEDVAVSEAIVADRVSAIANAPNLRY
jgi:hypothetical protein